MHYFVSKMITYHTVSTLKHERTKGFLTVHSRYGKPENVVLGLIYLKFKNKNISELTKYISKYDYTCTHDIYKITC